MSTQDDPQLDAMLKALPYPDAEQDGLDDRTLQRYRAGELSDAEAEAVEARLLSDPHARAVWQELARPVDPGLMESLAQHTLPGRRWTTPRMAMLAAAVLVAGVGSALWLTRGPTTPMFQTDYRLTAVKGGVQVARGDELPQVSGPIALAEGATLKVLLQPGKVDAVPDVGVYRVADGALVRVTGAKAESGDGGGLRVTAPPPACWPAGPPSSTWP